MLYFKKGLPEMLTKKAMARRRRPAGAMAGGLGARARRHRSDWPATLASSHRPTPPAAAGGAASRRRDCHSADIPSPSLLKHLLKGEGAAAE